MYENRESKIYFYGFSKTHQLQGNPWNLRGNWISVANIQDTARRMLHQLDTVEVIVVDATYQTAREYKDLTKRENYRQETEHILFYDYVKSLPHFEFRG